MNALKISLFAALLSGAGLAAAGPLQCNRSPAGLTDANVDAVTKALEQRLAAALGPKWVMLGPAAGKKKVEPAAMAAVAEMAGCAAVIDVGSSCASFFDPEFSTTLGIITNLPKKTLLRRQFDDALQALPEGKEKAAAQSCMKSVAK